LNVFGYGDDRLADDRLASSEPSGGNRQVHRSDVFDVNIKKDCFATSTWSLRKQRLLGLDGLARSTMIIPLRPTTIYGDSQALGVRSGTGEQEQDIWTRPEHSQS
jgi:hypothetical protein